jgi:hypothetical protein
MLLPDVDSVYSLTDDNVASTSFPFLYAVPFQIADCMLRTIKNIVDMTADMHKIPYLKIDLVYEEETGIQVVPTLPDIIATYHKIIVNVSTSTVKQNKTAHFMMFFIHSKHKCRLCHVFCTVRYGYTVFFL